MIRLLSYISIIPLVILLACGNSQNKEIDELLLKREKALEAKDVESYLTLISPDYSEERDGHTLTLEDIKKSFLTNVSLFDGLQISHTDRSIYMKDNKADVFQITEVRASINDSKSVFKMSEKIAIEKIGDKWLIVKESDADFFDGYVFGGSN
jgi:hypothetical protein